MPVLFIQIYLTDSTSPHLAPSCKTPGISIPLTLVKFRFPRLFVLFLKVSELLNVEIHLFFNYILDIHERN